MLCAPIPNRSQSLGEVTFIMPESSMKEREKFMANFQASHFPCRYSVSPEYK